MKEKMSTARNSIKKLLMVMAFVSGCVNAAYESTKEGLKEQSGCFGDRFLHVDPCPRCAAQDVSDWDWAIGYKGAICSKCSKARWRTFKDSETEESHQKREQLEEKRLEKVFDDRYKAVGNENKELKDKHKKLVVATLEAFFSRRLEAQAEAAKLAKDEFKDLMESQDAYEKVVAGRNEMEERGKELDAYEKVVAERKEIEDRYQAIAALDAQVALEKAAKK